MVFFLTEGAPRLLSERLYTPTHTTAPRLSSTVHPLDKALNGGLPIGGIVEWGMPLGGRSRELLLPWLASITTPLNYTAPGWVLWAYSWDYLSIYPPALAARGVSLAYTRFAKTTSPLEDLRPVFLQPFFRLIILDAPAKLSDQDLSFIARQARQLKQCIVIIRNSYLTSAQSHALVRTRLNSHYIVEKDEFRLDVLRGGSPTSVHVPRSEVTTCFS